MFRKNPLKQVKRSQIATFLPVLKLSIAITKIKGIKYIMKINR